MSAHRTANLHNIRIYHASNRTKAIAGLVLTNGITNNNFYYMLSVVLIFKSTYTLRYATGYIVPQDDHPLQVADCQLIIGESTLCVMILHNSSVLCRRHATDNSHALFDGIFVHNGYSGFVCRLYHRQGAISNLREIQRRQV